MSDSRGAASPRDGARGRRSPFHDIARAVARVARRFRVECDGATLLTFSLFAPVLLLAVALAIEYGHLLRLRGQLNTAADAAALAGVSAANTYISSYAGSGDPMAQAIAAGQAAASGAFNANAGRLANGAATATLNLTRSGTTLTGSVSYTYTGSKLLMPFVYGQTSTLSRTNSASITRATYVNIFVIIDNSGSMGIGATEADQSTIFYNNGGCALACHYAGQDSATPMRALGATLRIDVEKAAVHSALASIPTNSTYQVAIYAMSDKLNKVFALSNNIDAARQVVAPVAQNAASLDLANDANNGGTDFVSVMAQLKTELTGLKTPSGQSIVPGDGLTPQTPKSVVLLITDAIQNSYALDANGWGYFSGGFTFNSPCEQPTCYTYSASSPAGVEQSISAATCDPIKNLGYTLMTMNTTYLIPAAYMQVDAFYQGAFGAIQNYLLAQSSANMVACANSPSFAFAGSSPQELASATQAMFNAIPRSSTLRLTK